MRISILTYICYIPLIILFLLFIPMPAQAATYQSGYLTYSENEDGTLTVIGYDRSKHESPYNLKVNAYLERNNHVYSVTAIADSVFKGYTFHSIYVSGNINIGNHAFENVIVNNYKDSGYENETVIIWGANDSNNDSVTIGDYAFANAQFHSHVSFGNFTSVGDYAFYNASFDYLGYGVFQSVQHIGDYAFYNTDLSYPIIDLQYTYTIGDYAFYGLYLNSFPIWPSLQSVGKHALPEHFPLVITINSSVKDISHLSIEPIVWEQATVAVHVNSPVINYLKQQNITFNIIETGEIYYAKAKAGTIFTNSTDGEYVIDNSSDSLRYTGTVYLKVLNESSVCITQLNTNYPMVTLVESAVYETHYYDIVSIESNAFTKKNCPNLTSVDLEHTRLKTIKKNAFSSCSGLKEIRLPKTIKTIGKNAFPNSSKLEVVIPSGVTNIKNFNIKNLDKVVFVIPENSTLSKKLSSWKLKYRFKNSQTIVYPKPAQGKTYQKGNFQYKVTGDRTVTLLKTNKKNITKANIPTTVSLNSYKFNVNKIDKKAFYSCKKLKTVTIGNNVTYIGDLAFAKCSNLKSITFGKKIKKLGKKVLYYDKKLSTIKFEGTNLQSIGKQTFRKVPKKVNIIVPTSKVKKYSKLIKKAT